ncbi:MAG: cell division topological specificity factor MinE [Candidatus Eremiobacteraeota bacterium]|nr:cell division topological specificity factor MinE [Candidatus Eremiobacteraeota bacterium]
MIEFLKRLFGQQGSSATAKERLRLVLMTDHLELAPEMIESMKRDLVELISRYVEVDRERIEVNFERQDRTLAMLANIPILGVNRPNGNGAVTHETPRPQPEPVAGADAPSDAPAAETKPPVRKRKRRKKSQRARTQLPSTA